MCPPPVINTVMEPGRKPEQNKPSSSSSSSSTTTAAVRSTRPNTKDWRTTHSVSRRGGCHRPGENIRRAAVTPDDTRDGYIV